MSDKRAHILAKTLDLYRAQGIKSTTMQQVAEAAGVSKGALYLHFASKTALTMAAMAYLDDDLVAQVNQILERQDLSPREQLIAQIRFQFETLREDQQLTTEFWQDAGLQLDEEVVYLAEKIRLTWQLIQEKFLLRAYGSRVKPYVIDLSVILSGALNEYASLAILQGISLDDEPAAAFLVFAMDQLVAGLEREQPEPFLNETLFVHRNQVAAKLAEERQKRLVEALTDIKNHFLELDLTDSEAADLQAVLDLLARELAEPEPNRMLVQGLLANFRDWRPVQEPRRFIAESLKIKLL